MRRLAVAALLGACAVQGGAADAAAPDIDARAWLAQNPATGEILASQDIRDRVPIASITKLMTVIVALEHLKPGDVVRVDPRAAAVGQETVGLWGGEAIGVADLLKAALIQSANDAADALALATAPTFRAFAGLMNAKAQQLGLTDSHFVRPDGLDARDEYSSARDVTRLAEVAMRIPVVRADVGEATATIAGGHTLHTWNDLLGLLPGVFGVKTGHTTGAGWGQVAAVSANGTILYATVLGSSSRTERNAGLEALLVWGLAQYRQVDAVQAGRDYADVRLPFGHAPLALVASSSLGVAVRLGRTLSERVVAPTYLALPVRRGQALGRVEIWDGARLVGERTLVASRSVAAPALAGRIAWYLGRTVHHVVGLLP